MARHNQNKVPYDKQEKLLNEFCDTLAKLKNKNEVSDFLKDLLNRQERLMLMRRLQIADMLMNGCSYADIIKVLHVGEGTISRVSRWLNFGRNGYKKFLKKRARRK